ncbi:MAG: cation diffusion facilitator family transporter [Fibromonadales bacterium]|nr:cation diffusion facilitator family transporter [Fibromonadales bacterium]
MTSNRDKAGYLESIVSIIVNTALFALKLYTGIITGSIALIADAWHTLSDSLTSVVIMVAIKLSSKKPDKEHPFGHGRWEQIAALFVAFVLAVIAYEFIMDSIERFGNRQEANFGTMAIVVVAVSIVIKELLAQYAFYIAKKHDSAAIKADGWHHRSDALSSIPVLIGIFFASKFWWIDSVLGFILSLVLFYAAYKIAKETVDKLLGKQPSEELKEKIKNAIRSLNLGDLKWHHLHMHNYERHCELTMHIRLDGQKSIEEGHRIATIIENKIEEDFKMQATIHVEPLCQEHLSYSALQAEPEKQPL